MERALRLVIEDVSDRDLARRLKSGDPQGLADLYDRFNPTVYGIALRMVRNPSTAEDLMQETFIRIWRRIHLFDEERGRLEAWIVAVTRNRVLDYLRSPDCRAMRAYRSLDSVSEKAKSSGFQEEDALRRARLIQAVTALGENQRRVLELAYLEGLSQSEIAVRIDRPLGTVKTWARAALRALREQMAPAVAV